MSVKKVVFTRHLFNKVSQLNQIIFLFPDYEIPKELFDSWITATAQIERYILEKEVGVKQ